MLAQFAVLLQLSALVAHSSMSEREMFCFLIEAIFLLVIYILRYELRLVV